MKTAIFMFGKVRDEPGLQPTADDLHAKLPIPNLPTDITFQNLPAGHNIKVKGSSVHVKSGSFVHVRRLVVCARFCCVILSLYLCNMILLLAFFFSKHHHTTHQVMFFSSHLCVGLLFLGLYSLPSPPSPPELLLCLSTSPKLSHTTHRTHPTQLLSSHKSHNSCHITHLSQLILHNSTHSRAALVCHLVELLSCSHTEVHPSSFTELISQLTQRVTDHERAVRVSALQQER